MRFLDRNYKKPLSLYLVMTLLSLALLYYFHNLHTLIKENFTFHHEIERLQELDKELNLFVQSDVDYMNFDHVAHLTREFEIQLEKISNNPLLKRELQNDAIAHDLKTIRAGYRDKKREIERYIAQAAIANNSLHYLPLLLQRIEALNDPKLSQNARILYQATTQMALGEELGPQKYSKLITQLHTAADTPRKAAALSRFLAHQRKIDQALHTIVRIRTHLLSIHLEQKIRGFLSHLQSRLERTMQVAIRIDFMMIALLLLFTLLSGLLYYKRIRSENELRIFKEGVDKSDNAIVLTDAQHRIVYVNYAFEKSTGYSAAEVLGKTPALLKSGMMNESFYQELSKRIAQKRHWSGEFVNRRKDGSIYYEKASIIPITDAHGNLLNYMAIKLDITHDKLLQASIEKKNEEIYRKHYFDPLTRLPNRNKLLEDLAEREASTMILFNIDDFQQINDFYGLRAGDNVLIKFAQILTEFDPLLPARIYRMHADEFALLMRGEHRREEIETLIDHITTQVAKTNFFVSLEQRIIFSFCAGVAHTDGTKEPQKFLIEADLALKHAKRSSFSFAIFDASMQIAPEYEKNLQWLTRLREAIDEDRIEPWFQPIVAYPSRRIVSYESLIRMIDSAGAPISPFFFLDIAKKAKLYVPLTKLMIRKSFARFAHNDASFSLNFSYEDMADEGVVRYLSDALGTLPRPERFTAEILESESIASYDVTRSFIQTIKAFGCKVAIDDFGSGYSNFERIFQLGADYLKIDGSIVKHIDTNEQMRIIAETIVAFAQKSGMEVVAEFVHSEAIVELLQRMGVRLMQGYYFAPPAPTLEPDMLLQDEKRHEASNV